MINRHIQHQFAQFYCCVQKFQISGRAQHNQQCKFHRLSLCPRCRLCKQSSFHPDKTRSVQRPDQFKEIKQFQKKNEESIFDQIFIHVITLEEYLKNHNRLKDGNKLWWLFPLKYATLHTHKKKTKRS